MVDKLSVHKLRGLSQVSEQETLEKLQQKASTLRRKNGAVHVDSGHALLAVADHLIQMHRPEEAEQLYRQAADVYEKLGVGHELLLAIALRSLSHSLHVQGKATESQPLWRQANDLIAQNQ